MTVTAAEAKAWFDQLPPINPPGFEADHPGWEPRHYAPAIRLDGNARGATVQLAREVIDAVRVDAQVRTGAPLLPGTWTARWLAEHPEVGRRIHPGIPWTMSDTRCAVRSPAPLLGFDTEATLRELLGMDDKEIERLKHADVLT